MELQYFGANCVRITTKKAQLVVDDNLGSLGLKAITKPDDLSLHTSHDFKGPDSRFVANTPGEYEIADVVIHGVGARSLKDEEGRTNAVIYTVTADDLRVAIIGHIHPDLSDDQLEKIGLVDIAIVPVGGNAYTLDGLGALQIIKKLEPKIAIPTHFEDKATRYEVPQQSLAEALKGLAMEPLETLDKYKPKHSELADTTHLIVLNRQ